jgi:hypothetical protein
MGIGRIGAALGLGIALAAAAVAQDPRSAAVSAAMPPAGSYEVGQDIVDVSGSPPALTVLRFYGSPKGMLQVQIRVWTVADTVSEAEALLSPEAINAFGGQLIEVAGHKGSFMNNVLTLYPDHPNGNVSVAIGGAGDLATFKTLAEQVNYEALKGLE